MFVNFSSKMFSFFSGALPIIFALIGFGLLIIVHECGHFLFCKLFNIYTPTFSIGMGPTLINKKIGTTNFRLAAIPLGGYVEIAGHEEVGQGSQEHAAMTGEGAFASKPYWQKFLVMMGGIIFNIAFAYIVLSLILMIGVPKHNVTITKVVDGSIAQSSGLAGGDTLIKIGTHQLKGNLEALPKALKEIQEAHAVSIPFIVMRNNTEQEVMVTIPENNASASKTGKIGIELGFAPSDEIEKYGFVESIRLGIKRTNSLIYQTILGLKDMITRRSLKGAGGPVMIISESVKQAQSGFGYLLIFLALISINLAIMNLIPLPILDGGQLLFISLEALIGRPIPATIKNSIFIGSWIAVLALFVYLTYSDIMAIFKK